METLDLNRNILTEQRISVSERNEPILRPKQFLNLELEFKESETMKTKNMKKSTTNEMNTKKESFYEILKEYLKTPVAEATVNIFLTPHIILKIFLTTFVLCSSGLASYLVIDSILSYFNYDVSSTSRTIYETPTLFPKVTFCNVNRFATKFAYDLINSGLESANLITIDEKKNFSHDLNDILINCSFNRNPCNSSDFIWSFDQYYGNCFIFNSGVDSNGKKVGLKESAIAYPLYGLNLELYVNIHEEFLVNQNGSINGLGGLIRLGNSSYSTYYLDDGIFLSPGYNTYISMDREFKSSLAKPYSDCEIDSNSPLFIPGYDIYNLIAESEYAYSQQLCIMQCNQKYLINKYNCTSFHFLSLYNVSFCSFPVMDLIDQSDNFDNRKCFPQCPLECNQNLFKTAISAYQLKVNKEVSRIQKNSNLASDFINRSIDVSTVEQSLVKVVIYYGSLSFTETTELPRVDLVTLLGSIGGNLGLFLGISVFSLCEIFEAIIEIYFKLKDKDKKIKTNSSN